VRAIGVGGGRCYLEAVASLYGVHPDGPEDSDDLPQGVAGHLQAVHVLDRRALIHEKGQSHEIHFMTKYCRKYLLHFSVWIGRIKNFKK
jgi:hypothetical protein